MTVLVFFAFVFCLTVSYTFILIVHQATDWETSLHEQDPWPQLCRSKTSHYLWGYYLAANKRLSLLCNGEKWTSSALPMMTLCVILTLRKMGLACRMRVIKGHYDTNDFNAQWHSLEKKSQINLDHTCTVMSQAQPFLKINF